MKFETMFYGSLMGLMTICMCQSVSAGLMIEFSIDGGLSFSDNFDIKVGESLAVEVYLNDNQSGGLLDTEGLLGFGLNAATVPTTLGSISNASISSQLDTTITDTFTVSTLNWVAFDLNDPIPTGQSMSLGSFTFDSTDVGSTVVRFGDIQPGAGTMNTNWLSGMGSELDQDIFGVGASAVYELTINASAVQNPTVVPEPASCGLIMLAFVGSVLRRSRRGKETTVVANVTRDNRQKTSF